jgi:hypothetical protein
MNLIKAEPDAKSEMYLASPHSENELTEGNGDEDPLFLSFPIIKTENVCIFIITCPFTIMHACMHGYYLWLHEISL